MVLSLQTGMTIGVTDYKNTTPGLNLLGLAEYFFPTSSKHVFGLRLFFGSNEISGKDNRNSVTELNGNKYELAGTFVTSLLQVGGGLSYSYTLDDQFFPYIYSGVSYTSISPKDNNGSDLPNYVNNVYNKSSISYDTELGLRFQVQQGICFFGGLAYHALPTDYLDDVATGKSKDSYYTSFIGISFSFFGKKDSDHDGILDDVDKCPNDPEDYDGFQDDDGCPDPDNDNDGIIDKYDKCPNDPEDYDGFKDDDGCPDIDNDGDGIPDTIDKCPNAAEDFDGFQDNDGCPDYDNDNDGIPDSVDQCPNDPEDFDGFQDEDGCPETKVPQNLNQITIDANKTFIGTSNLINPNAYNDLDKIIRLLKSYPNINWRVEGHMDSSGPQQYIRTMSLKRAERIVDYFIQKGLPASKFHAYGMGDKFPVANNTTEEGRMKNRRIVITRQNQ
jgi:outer membrane protein OmpA-like peptidoglycan-associated protein